MGAGTGSTSSVGSQVGSSVGSMTDR
jgi:hypothetical protein